MKNMIIKVSKLLVGVAAVGLLALSFTTLSPATVGAETIDPFETVCGGDNADSVVCKNSQGSGSISGLINRVINIMLFILGAVAVIMIIFSGFRFATSAGDPTATKSARNTILYAVIGLVVAIFSYAIVNFVIKDIGGGGGDDEQSESTSSGERSTGDGSSSQTPAGYPSESGNQQSAGSASNSGSQQAAGGGSSNTSGPANDRTGGAVRNPIQATD